MMEECSLIILYTGSPSEDVFVTLNGDKMELFEIATTNNCIRREFLKGLREL